MGEIKEANTIELPFLLVPNHRIKVVSFIIKFTAL